MFLDPKGCRYSVILYGHKHGIHKKVTIIREEEQFAFTVASHELNMTSYEYVVSIDDEILDEGDFILHPGENTTVNVSCIPENSSLVLVDHAEHNRSLRIPQKIELITFLKSENFTKIEKGLFFKGAIPLIDGKEISTFINLTELKEDIVLYNYTDFHRFGDINKLESVNLTMGRTFQT